MASSVGWNLTADFRDARYEPEVDQIQARFRIFLGLCPIMITQSIQMTDVQAFHHLVFYCHVTKEKTVSVWFHFVLSFFSLACWGERPNMKPSFYLDMLNAFLMPSSSCIKMFSFWVQSIMDCDIQKHTQTLSKENLICNERLCIHYAHL